MIIIEDKNMENMVYFPKNLYRCKESDSYNLTLNNRATNQIYTFDTLVDQKKLAYDYYSFIITFRNVPNGEYEYKIGFDDKIVASGIIKVKTKDDNVIYYDKNREYIAYDKQ